MVFSKYSTMFCCFLFCNIAIADVMELEMRYPSLDPPCLESKDIDSVSIIREATAARSVMKEWAFHKTLDGLHPDGLEQQIIWLMNRARANPTQEGIWLASSNDPKISSGRTYFGVDIEKLKSEFAVLSVKPPVAFDSRLYAAAFEHSTDLISRDAQDHNQQFERVDAAGFHYSIGRGNVFSYASSGLNAHAAWNIDWGYESDGMQTGRGHRLAVMAVDGDYANVGIAAIYETDPDTEVGEYAVTGNYCQANTDYAGHFNIFIVGTVWEDINHNHQYDPGEGKGNVNVSLYQGDYYAITGKSGGYAIPVAQNVSYQVTFDGESLTKKYIKDATVSDKSVLVDLEIGNSFYLPSLPAILFLLN